VVRKLWDPSSFCLSALIHKVWVIVPVLNVENYGVLLSDLLGNCRQK